MKQTVFLAAGGTGGMSSRRCVAEQLSQQGLRPVLITDQRGRRIISEPPQGMAIRTIAAATPLVPRVSNRSRGWPNWPLAGCNHCCWHCGTGPKL